MPSVIMLNVNMLSVVMLNVVAHSIVVFLLRFCELVCLLMLVTSQRGTYPERLKGL
jgi:hypothetical protein